MTTPLSPDRYQIRFTARKSTRDKLRLAQDLLRHTIPDGDPDPIFDRALTLLLADIARQKAAITPNPRQKSAAHKDGRAIRRRTRYIPAHVRRTVWIRDGGRCKFVGKTGHRCDARAFLEFHHLDADAVGGESSEGNIELRCGAHNRYEAVLFYGREVIDKTTRSGASRPSRAPAASAPAG